MEKIKLIKQKLGIRERKEIEITKARLERAEAMMEYIAICDHPEMLEEGEEDGIGL